ncbi:MAG: type IX secretion system protein PorQ [Bacteroidia bacterium]|nr:type IX secretion system protein PorQ [Bacteroidia bacterium]
MNKIFLCALVFGLIVSDVSAQLGGRSVFSFLDLSSSARIAALGGTFISVRDNDPNPATMNPSLLNASMNNMLSFSGVKYFADVKGGDASFTRSYEKVGTFQAAVHYINYGTFKNTDVYGNINGDFTAADLAFQMGWGYQANPFFTIGADMKFVYSHYESYSSTGIVGDLGVTYVPDSSRGIAVSLLARNIGGQLKRYDENIEREPINSEVIAGFSKKFSHAPFRVIVTYRHLEKFDYTYLNPLTELETDPITGDKIAKDITFFDKFSRHFILGTELVFSTNFNLRFAYNFQRRAEMRLDNAAGLTGMSLGFGIKVNRFHLAYGYAAYHVAGGTNHITVSTNPYDFFRKKSSGD